jgi:hypothetical protein
MDIDAAGQNHLNTISKWGKFIAITGLILIGLVVLLLAIEYNEIINRLGDLMSIDTKAAGVLIAIVGIFLGLFIIMLVYLLRACVLIKQGLISQNSDRIAEGFKAMKAVFTISIIFSSLAILSSIIGMINS